MKSKQISSAEKTIRINSVDFAHKDILRVVDNFYTQIQHDSILQVPFKTVSDWPEHIQKLTHFWWVRFGGRPYLPYQYNPVAKHFQAGFNREFLTRWLSIFHGSVQTQLRPDQANLWKKISEQMGETLIMKNVFFRREYET